MAGTGRVLVADDEETFLFSTADLLRREGFECDCVRNAADASLLLGEKEYDVLIADIRMPGNSKLELSERYRRLPRECPSFW